MKAWSHFISGPIYEKQSQRLVDVLLVVSAIVNYELDLNPNLFVKNIE